MNKQIRIVRKNTMIISYTNKGIIFEMAKFKNTETINNKRIQRFNYDDKVIFTFNNFEAAKIVRAIEKQFVKNGFNDEIKFTHLESKEPKNILLQFSKYNNKIQCNFLVSVPNNSNKNVQIYLDEAEMEILKEVLRSQYSFIFSKIIDDSEDDYQFKNFVFNSINEKRGVK